MGDSVNYDGPSDFFEAIPSVPEDFMKKFGTSHRVGPCDPMGDVTDV